MDYRSYMNQVMELPFINDEKAADSAIKTVLGVLASKIDEDWARELTNILPPELDFSTLRGQQQAPVQLSIDDFFSAVAEQMHLDWQQARDLVGRVFHCVKESEEGADIMGEIETKLPPDWAAIVDQA
ncbi:protein of unknown function DUF2267 [Geotalea daltonii FRC-32]|uniref:DUF2267 domain-containing protein n=1 Tax=Geotalea daltonii (strain DSM 22248 / JCM 15807 / FRC-32) TaxID=316067 RepID=B9M9C5_GEODF|nr:DUF2267 domain-containing protein [Geotalea daltonii]ACM18683.1 protein of unknown function DUF2267 [Geotalea daltonii FRC-32]